MRAAAGLNAFKKFFKAMPAESGMAFVLIAYLDPIHDSLMAELLARQTPMPVREAKAHTATEWVLVEQKNRN
jgi:two-component system CheB/CheR fusion protein